MVGQRAAETQQVQDAARLHRYRVGVLLGSIPFYLRIPARSSWAGRGTAGGGAHLSRIGSIGKLYWFMPPSANLALREIGIVLFLAVVGFKSGAGFIDTLINGDGPAWMMHGVAITLIPLLLVGVLARHYGKLNYLTLCGLLAGSMTDPPALAFANGMHPTSGASALSYATVYPLVMFLRIISPQLLAILLWAGV
ncbi:hypothetical protein [Aeromonas caviae]|uniref:aspartate-alanine antiporter-like transporter n=1 Tax=Aeromonas caviae TaxID=648 RepID=UPI001F4E47E1|nr:hypothetical protein [Aeromonas caviae]